MSDKHPKDKTVTSRRDFLRNALVGGSAVAVAAFTAGARADEAPAREAPAPKAEPLGYHVTPHILDYYKTAGL
jgi:hypothetical protein